MPNKILLVEDEPNIAKLFNYILTKAGYKVSYAENGSVGYKKTMEDRPDLIISDIMMPETDGFAFRKMLLNNPDVANIPFVFLTAKGTEEDILEAYNLSIEDYIIKTASPKIVVAKIDSIFNSIKREQEKANEAMQQAAGSLNATLVPGNSPVLEGYNFEFINKPFDEIPGGDFIDFIPLDKNNLAIILGDVMGKKWGAWYFAVAYAGYVRNAVRMVCNSIENFSAKLIMEKLNEAIYNDERISEVFITLSVVIVNKINNSIKYCGAGDLPLLLLKDEGYELVKSNGLLLGFSLEGNYSDIEIEMHCENSVVLFTDGLIDVKRNDGKVQDIDTIAQVVFKLHKNKNSLTDLVKEFIDSASEKFPDDLSLIKITKLNQNY
ncbi:MAG TPA: response regulator [Melioribacteraceae bacterium]|nr:response regulator [Melioribacteraceae bacterium]